MKRVVHAPRPQWQDRVEAVGFQFHTIPGQGGTYWDEAGHWEFTAAEVDVLEAATERLYAMCLEAAACVVAERRFGLMGIPATAIPAIERSWSERDTARSFPLYGRFDLAYTGGDTQPKLLEFNADTPTGLYEASVVQWQWLEDWNASTRQEADQFNSIHEKLVERWRAFARAQSTDAGLRGMPIHLACLTPHPEDEGTTDYIGATALDAGLAIERIAIQDIGWFAGDRRAPGRFVDLQDRPISTLFKLYPWEFMLQEEFGQNLVEVVADSRIAVIEPAWKMILSNKAILAVLWELFPHDPLLAEAHLSPNDFGRALEVVAKPFMGREGANISIAELAADGSLGRVISETAGEYGAEGYVYQERVPLAQAKDARGAACHAVVGSWIVPGWRDGETVGLGCGVGMREDSGPITRDTSRFVPHVFR